MENKCKRCGTVDAYTMVGHAYCAECTEYKREQMRSRRASLSEEEKQISAKKQKERRQRYELEGRCNRCGRPLPQGYGKKLCLRCLVHNRIYKRRNSK